MKIAGLMMNRNEAERAHINLSYHLNNLGLDEIMFIDDCSSDNSAEFIDSFNDKRITIHVTDGLGINQIKYGNMAIEWALGQKKFDAIIPIDCDMFWVYDRKYLEDLISQNYGYIIVPNYCMHPDIVRVNKPNEQKYTQNFWNYITYKNSNPVCMKTIITKLGYEKFGCRTSEGNHTSFCAPDTPKYQVQSNDLLKILEYSVISHSDYVRKTVNSSVGRILAHGAPWVHGRTGLGDHTVRDLNSLCTVGHLQDRWKNYYLLNDDDLEKMNKNGMPISEDCDLSDTEVFLI